jgi:hypothetical protein
MLCERSISAASGLLRVSNRSARRRFRECDDDKQAVAAIRGFAGLLFVLLTVVTFFVGPATLATNAPTSQIVAAIIEGALAFSRSGSS